jgi:FAD/FMN-containing dehydrogenase
MPSELERWRNFEGNLSCMADIRRAQSVEDLQAIVAEARRDGRTIRVSSGGRPSRRSVSYSLSPVVVNEGEIIVYTPGLDRGFVHADGSRRITAQAGMPIGELSRLAAAHGLGFETMPVPAAIQVGGAVALANHGVTNAGGTLSDLVVGMKLLLADGTVREITEAEPELLRAARVNLGVLGIVLEVTFQCVPRFKLATVDAKVSWRETVENIEDVIAAYDYLDLVWFLFTDTVWLKGWKKVPDSTPLKRVPGVMYRAQDWLAAKVSAAALTTMMRFERSTPLALKALATAVFPVKRVAYADEIFHYVIDFPNRMFDLSWSFDVGEGFENFKRCCRHMQETLERYARPKRMPTSPFPWHYDKDGRFPQKFATHIRFVRSSDAYLAPPNGNRFTAYVEALSHKDANCADYFAELQAFWATMGARPHWGKTFDTTLDFEQLYGDDWRRFNQIRRELDPNGLFLNDFMRHVFKDNSRSARPHRPGTPEVVVA